MIITIFIFTIICLFVCLYKDSVENKNKLIENLQEYDKKEKAKQQESKILGQKSIKQQSSEKKNTRMYHI